MGDRFSSNAVEIVAPPNNLGDDDDPGRLRVVTTRAVSPGELLFRLKRPAVWTAADAYRDRDLGPKLQDYAREAGGGGFDVVALAGVLAAERVRRFRSREGLGVAPESAGFTVPSRWGALARWLWSEQEREDGSSASAVVNIEEPIQDAVSQGVNLLVPLLDVAARRYWSADRADMPDGSAFPADEKWTRKALVDDGAPRSWSRSDLERVALLSMDMVLNQAQYPPPFLVEGVGSLIPEPFVKRDSDPPEAWPKEGATRAFVPLVSDLVLVSSGKEVVESSNAVIGTPPPSKRRGDNEDDDCVWCIATRKLDVGERVQTAPDLWT